MSSISRISSLIQQLASTDPKNPEVEVITNMLVTELGSGHTASDSMNPDVLLGQIKKLHTAAVVPAANYAKIANITAGLARLVEISRRPQNSKMRPRVAQIVSRLAGIFSECDTADELSSHSLLEIEEAVHKLYSNGTLNKPSTYNFQTRGKGHHGES